MPLPARLFPVVAAGPVLACGVACGQGGDTPEDATPIDALPFVDQGSTVGFANDADEDCPFKFSAAPDVFYRYTPASSEVLRISLCESEYDTKLYVYDSRMSAIACNDDACSDASGNPFRSRLEFVEVEAGETYLIVVDGFGTEAGNYTLEVDVNDLPCIGEPAFLGTEHALTFHAGDSVSVPDAAALRFDAGEPITLEAWVRPLAFDPSNTIFSKSATPRQNYGLRIGSDASITFSYRNASQTGSFEHRSPGGVLEPAAWNHVAVSYAGFGGSDIALYVNGVFVGGAWNEPPTEGPFVGNEDLLIGASLIGGTTFGRYFNGTIDELRIWRAARTRDEIVATMRTPLAGDEVDVVANWRLDEGAGMLAADLTGTHDGTIAGAAWRALAECVEPCAGDATFDGAVDVRDLLAVLGSWRTPGGAGDVTGDGIVDVQDLLLVLARWGPCALPSAACCVDGTCIESTAAACLAAGGVYSPGDACGDGVCEGDAGWIVTAPTIWFADSCGAGNACLRGEARDQQWVVTIPEPGEWIFTVCGATWDTIIAIGTSPCSDDVGGNDDAEECGAASEVVLSLDAGTYFVTLEGFVSSDCGAYTLVIGPIR